MEILLTNDFCDYDHTITILTTGIWKDTALLNTHTLDFIETTIST